MEELYWDSAYAIAIHLRHAHPGVDVTTLTLKQVEQWTLALPNFCDDPQLVNDDLLADIISHWYEETFRP